MWQCHGGSAVQSQKAVAAYISRAQLLPLALVNRDNNSGLEKKRGSLNPRSLEHGD